MQKCNVCNKMKRTVSLEPSRSTLLFGMQYGRVSYEYRCASCEAKLTKMIDRLLNVKK